MGKVEGSKALVGRASGNTFVLPGGARGQFLSTGSMAGVRPQANSMGMKGKKC